MHEQNLDFIYERKNESKRITIIHYFRSNQWESLSSVIFDDKIMLSAVIIEIFFVSVSLNKNKPNLFFSWRLSRLIRLIVNDLLNMFIGQIRRASSGIVSCHLFHLLTHKFDVKHLEGDVKQNYGYATSKSNVYDVHVQQLKYH